MLRVGRCACSRPTTHPWMGRIARVLEGYVVIEHAHFQTTLCGEAVLPGGVRMMSHVRITEPWESGKPTRVPLEAGVRPAKGGGPLDPFCRPLCATEGPTGPESSRGSHCISIVSVGSRWTSRTVRNRRNSHSGAKQEHRLG